MPHFLIDASLPRRTLQIFASRGDEATDVRDIGLGSADDETIASYAKSHEMAIVTRDGVGDIRNYPPTEYAGILVVDAPDDFTASQDRSPSGGFSRHRPADRLEPRVTHLGTGSRPHPGKLMFPPSDHSFRRTDAPLLADR